MLKEVVEALEKLKGSTLILTHHNADIDAIASALSLHLGLSQLGLKSTIGVSESVSRPAKNIKTDIKIEIDPDCKKFDNILVVETSTPEQLKSIKNLRADIIVDHHPSGPLAVRAKAIWIDPDKKSASQMVYEILKNLNCKIDDNLAKIILAGIISDTSHLRLADKSTLKIVIELLEKNITIEEVMNIIQTEPDISEVIACSKAVKRAELYKSDDFIIAFSAISSHEAASCRALQKMGFDISIVAALKKDEIRISSRGKGKILKYGIDLSEIFKEVGNIIDGNGGGHNLAGSANGKNKKALRKAFEYILKEISNKTGKEFKKISE